MSIKVNNVSYTYLAKTPNSVKALDNINLEIKSGKVTAIIGHTGSGKSTLIQMFNALLLPSEGTIDVDGFIIGNKERKNKDIKKLRRHVATVFQFPEAQLFEETVEDDVAFGLKNYGIKEDIALRKAHEALKLVGIDESFYKRSPFDLSGGEKRRVAIAGILVLEPDILILDEPTAGLDPEGTQIIIDLIKTLNGNGKTIILVSHNMDIVLGVAHDVIVLNDGKFVYQGTPQELFAMDQAILNFEIPTLYKFAQDLVKKGIKIDIKKIYDIKSLFNQIEGKGDEWYNIWSLYFLQYFNS